MQAILMILVVLFPAVCAALTWALPAVREDKARDRFVLCALAVTFVLVIALCLTSFLQTTLLFLGLLTWQTNMILAIGVMLSANEVPRIAQQFGLDTSVHVNMMSVTSTVNSAVRAGTMVARAVR